MHPDPEERRKEKLGARGNDRFGRVGALKPAKKRGAQQDQEVFPQGQEPIDRAMRMSELKLRPPMLRGMRAEIPEGAERLAWLLGATARTNKYGEHLKLRRWFGEATGAGARDAALGPALEGPLDMRSLRLLAPGASEMAADPSQWLFLDTETTGLAGGTGT